MDYVRESIKNLTNHFFTKKEKSMTIANHLFSKEEYKDKNVVFSPLSLQTALSLLAVGSEGPTQNQLLSFLGSKSIGHLNSLSSHVASAVLKDAAPAGGPCLSSANAVWVEKTLSVYPSFKETVATHYMATLKSLDFINNVRILLLLLTLYYK
jgi:serpin B